MLGSNSFKLPSFFLVTTISGLLTVGCSLPSPEKKDAVKLQNETANFSIKSYKAEIQSQNRNHLVEITSNLYFEACLSDIARGKSIQNMQFEIVEQANQPKTNLEGCISWTEKINTNLAEDPKNILLKRTIKGQGVFHGQRSIEFVFNPWATEKSEMISDKKKTTVTTVTEEQAKNQSMATVDSKSKLWIEDARLLAAEKNTDSRATKISYDIKFTPTALLKNHLGQLVATPITEGRFKAKIQLISKISSTVDSFKGQNSSEKWYSLAQSDEVETEVVKGILGINADLALSLIPTRGQVYLAISLTPAGQNEKLLTPFEGIFLIGESESIKNSAFLKAASSVMQNGDFKISNLNLNIPDEKIDGFQTAKNFEIAPLEFRFLRVGNETTTSKDVFFQIKACMKNGIDQKTIRSQSFAVLNFRSNLNQKEEVIKVKTDNSSCINWEVKIPTQVYACQHFIRGFVTIINADYGISQSIPVAINPWEHWGAAGRDLRYFTEVENQQSNCAQQNETKSQIQVSSFSYSTESYSYKVDKNLNLEMNKKVILKMEPKVISYSNTSDGRESYERIRDGLYLLRLAVVKNQDYFNQNHLVTYSYKVVTALAGEISTQVEWNLNDFKALGNRNTLLIEILPIKEKALKDINVKLSDEQLLKLVDTQTGLVSPTFAGPIVINQDEISRLLKRVDVNQIANQFIKNKNIQKTSSIIENIVKHGIEERERQIANINKMATKQNFAARENLSLFMLNNPQQAQFLAKIAGLKLDDAPSAYYNGENNKDLTLAYSRGQMDYQSFAQFIKTGAVTSTLTDKLCAWWTHDFFVKMYARKGGVLPEKSRVHFFTTCVAESRKNAANFFAIERLIIPHKATDIKLKTGTNFGLSVGTSFSLSNSHSASITRSSTTSVKAGLSFKYFDFISVGFDKSYSISDSISDSKSNSNSISVSGSTSMSVQKNTMQIGVTEFEKCVSVKLNPLLFVRDEQAAWYNRKKDFTNSLNPQLKSDEAVDAMTRGLMICDGQVLKTPVNLTENYYMINQETSTYQLQDMGDERNRQFFMVVRGDSDFLKVMHAIKGRYKMPENSQGSSELHGKAISSLTSVFAKGSGSFPSIFKY